MDKTRSYLFANWSEDVVMIVNGRRVTKTDILNNKRARQRRRLAWKLARTEPVTKPCFIWVFHNDSLVYYGWWLYVQTLHKGYGLNFQGKRIDLITKVMAMYPCGYEPVQENFRPWMEAFAAQHSRPTAKRPENNGLALARAVIAPGGQLLDVLPWITQEE